MVVGNPLCDPTCTDGDPAAHDGQWWVWFGGVEIGESAHAVQVIDTPQAQAWMSFMLRIPEAAGTGDDILAVLVDGVTELVITDLEAPQYAEYTPVVLDVSAIADGQPHEIGFAANFPSLRRGVTSFYVDSVSVTPCDPSE